MHHIYHTEGIILGSKNFRESDKYYYIFTRDLGMIYASATGVRKMSSKLRFILQDFAYLKLDIVQGKSIFRVTSASKTNTLENLTKNRERYRIVSNIAKLLKRLLAGVEVNENLFEDIKAGLSLIEKTNTKEELANLEIVIVLKMLNNLGYIGDREGLKELLMSPFEEGVLLKASLNRRNILNHINQALKETQL